MPRKPSNEPPPKVMTWRKAMPVILVGFVFDALRFLFEWFIIAGPAIGAAFCSYIVQSDNTILNAAKVASCTVGATAVGIVAAPAIAGFGVIMAMAVGFLGWFFIGGYLFMTNRRIFKENALWFVLSLVVSEVPLLGSVPAISITLWKMYRTQIRTELAARKRYDEKRAAEMARLALENAAEAQYAAQAAEIPEGAAQPA
ncbi:MAG TPA: hypothetical protein VFP46_00685 [Candidatus Paceibacterota bacterium]|nr:hypothetical protein [Candidatus Paceibacterota bacterium]